MDFKFSFIWETLPLVLAAIPVTMLLTFFPVIVGAVIGFFLALVRIRKIPAVSQLVALYLSFFRSVPILLLLFIAYFGIPKLLNFIFHGGMRVISPSSLSSLVTALLILTLYAGAFICEIIRGALSSVDMRQMEAAHALGMTKFKTYIRIVIPQAVIVALPNYFNFVLGMLKGSSVVFVISVMDMMSAAKVAAEDGYRFVEAYVLVGTMYVVFSVVFSLVFGKVERWAKMHMGIIVKA